MSALALALGWLGCHREQPHPDRPHPPAPTATATSPTPRADADGDGYLSDVDCDDHDPKVFPGAPERCNGIDDDCDGELHPYADSDNDGDGFIWCEDCDDRDPASFAGAPDPLDGVDQDCDGTDGVGVPLPPPAYGWPQRNALFGFALDVADFDGDGCDDLFIGQPSDPTLLGNLDGSVSVRWGCGDGALETLSGTDPATINFGFGVDAAAGTLAVLDILYNGAGGAFLYQAPLEPTSEPVLEVIAADSALDTDDLVLLGEPPQWLALASNGSGLRDAQYNLLALPRTGTVRLLDEPADVIVTIPSNSLYTGGRIADIGDRDGDGLLDLGVGIPVPDDAVYFLSGIASGSAHDAPEVWHGPEGALTGVDLGGATDLDGDGLDDALIYAPFAFDYAGAVWLAPWLGPGDRSLEQESPAVIEGELLGDLTGNSLALGDLDGDGQTDLVVGAPGDWSYQIRAGKVLVFRGPLQGHLTHEQAERVWVGERWGDHAGAAVAVGDLDGSGQLDIAVGAPFATPGPDDHSGTVHILFDPL